MNDFDEMVEDAANPQQVSSLEDGEHDQFDKEVNGSPSNMDINRSGELNPMTPIGLSIKIEEGMEFDCLEKVYEVYSNFARYRGFGLRRRSSKNGYCVFVCTNEGKNSPRLISKNKEDAANTITRKRTSSVRTGCRAALHVLKHKWKTTWIVTKFNNEHNHKLVTPRSVPLIRCHRRMPEIARCLTEKFLDAGVQTSKVVRVVDDGGSFFDKRDCWNHVNRLRLQNLDVGDAQYVYNYCRLKKEAYPEFFYSIQCDDSDRMVNFFWVDGQSRTYYTVFGDAVAFDTTYKTNKYSMSFAPFTGINHHMKSMLFGCALLQDESESTFIWLFETWLEAMNGKMPIAIITDQDHAIGNAISKVFPDTVHRLCIWHIMRKFPEKLASIYHKNSSFKKSIKQCIRQSFTIDEFEMEWLKLMEDHNLTNNGWLKGLFEIRVMWVPIYSRDTFFGGMNTTQRSESMNSFFDHFVNARTKLREFVQKFDVALQGMYECEKQEDYESRHKQRMLHLQSKLEEHSAEIYTTRVFDKVYDELEKVNKFRKEKKSKIGNLSTYLVTFIDNPRDFATVQFNSDSLLVECSCKLWNLMGLLCRHVFAIFQKKNVHMIPSNYILPRWSKEANVGMDMIDISGKLRNADLLITFNLQRQFRLLFDVAKTSDGAYKYICDGLEKLHVAVNELFPMEKDGDTVIELNEINDSPIIEDNTSTHHIKDPNVAQTKGRKKDSVGQTSIGRFKSSLEVALNKTRVCKRYGERGHNVRTCKIVTMSQP